LNKEEDSKESDYLSKMEIFKMNPGAKT